MLATNKKLHKLILIDVENFIDKSSTSEKLAKLLKQNDDDVLFLPEKYKKTILMFKLLNIQFGNFLETTIKNIVQANADNMIIEKYSGKKTNSFHVSKESITLVDSYIAECQLQNFSESELKHKFNTLLKNIIDAEAVSSHTENISHDIDLLVLKFSLFTNTPMPTSTGMTRSLSQRLNATTPSHAQQSQTKSIFLLTTR